MFPWLHDSRLAPNGVEIVLVGRWLVHTIPAASVASISRYEHFSLSDWGLLDLRSRFADRSFVLLLRSGWFARKVAISPPDPAAFIAWAELHGIPLSSTPRS